MQIIQNRKKFFILSLLVIIIGFGFMNCQCTGR